VVTGVALLTAMYAARSAAHVAASGGTMFSVPAFQEAFTFAALVCLVAVGLALIPGKSTPPTG
jgi:hypothetical protein